MSRRGFTLVELMVAMAIAGILISLIFAVYTRMSVAYTTQNQITDVNQNLRAAQGRIVSELRLAGSAFPSADLYMVDPSLPDVPDPSSNAYSPDGVLPARPQIVNGAGHNGLKVSANFTLPGQGAGHPLRPIYVTNGGGIEPDEITVFYADYKRQVGVETLTVTSSGVDVTLRTGQANLFEVNDLVMLVNPRLVETKYDLDGDGTDEAYDRTEYESCLLQVTQVNALPPHLQFSGATTPYDTFNAQGTAPHHHCRAVADHHTADLGRSVGRTDTFLVSFAARGYRIDPARRQVGVLQARREVRASDGLGGGVLLSGWQDLGIGFTNLQIATLWLEPNDATDDDASLDTSVDPLDDPERDWRSGENQEAPLSWISTNQTAASPIRVTLTLEARSIDEVDGVPTTTLPAVASPVSAAADINQLGDLPAIDLSTATDPRYSGENIFRRTTIAVELRSSAAGRW